MLPSAYGGGGALGRACCVRVCVPGHPAALHTNFDNIMCRSRTYLFPRPSHHQHYAKSLNNCEKTARNINEMVAGPPVQCISVSADESLFFFSLLSFDSTHYHPTPLPSFSALLPFCCARGCMLWYRVLEDGKNNLKSVHNQTVAY